MNLVRTTTTVCLMCMFASGLTWAQEERPAAAPAGGAAVTPSSPPPGTDVAGEQTSADDPFGLNPKPRVSKAEVSAATLDQAAGNVQAESPSVLATDAGSEAVRRIEAALQLPMAVEFHESPLAEARSYLQEAAKIPILIDRKSLDEVGLGSDTPVTISMQGVSLKSLLRHMLGELDLTYMVRDEVLVITTPGDVERHLLLRFYPVADFAVVTRPPLLSNQPLSPFQSIAELIRKHVSPDSWDEAGGAGGLLINDAGKYIAIDQTAPVHERIEALLATLRQARHVSLTDPAAPRSFSVVSSTSAAADARIGAQLLQNVDLAFNEAPLSEVVAFVQDTASIPILIDRKALDDVGLGTDTPVTQSLHAISLRSALRILLRDLDLTFVVQDEVLEITTPEDAETCLLNRVFRVDDLIVQTNSDEAPRELQRQVKTLETLIGDMVLPDTWDEVGGAGALTSIAPWGIIVVSQTDDGMEQIEDLLAAARKVPTIASETAEGVALPNPFSDEGLAVAAESDALVLRAYPAVAGIPTAELTALITGTVRGQWQQHTGSSSIFPVGQWLIIRQTPAAHAEIDELLQSLRTLSVGGLGGYSGAGIGMGGGFF